MNHKLIPIASLTAICFLAVPGIAWSLDGSPRDRLTVAQSDARTPCEAQALQEGLSEEEIRLRCAETDAPAEAPPPPNAAVPEQPAPSPQPQAQQPAPSQQPQAQRPGMAQRQAPAAADRRACEAAARKQGLSEDEMKRQCAELQAEPQPEVAPAHPEVQAEPQPEAAPAPPEIQAQPAHPAEPQTDEPPAQELTADQPPPAAAEQESVFETQLETQGDQEEAKNFRALRKHLSEERKAVEEEQVGEEGTTAGQQQAAPSVAVQDGSRDGDRRRPVSEEANVVEDFGARFIIQLGSQFIIRQDEATETERFLYRARDAEVENLRGGRTRTTITRDDGVKIVTVRDRYGDIIIRTRIDRRGREIVLIDNRDFYEGDRRAQFRYDIVLPPLRIGIPREEYIVETRRADRRAIRVALMAPPVEEMERVYALEEVRANVRLRDKMRRIDLDTITFDFGSASISPTQFGALAVVGEEMADVLRERPDEVFLIEGHTDAVGSNYANLLLSDRRAEAVAVALSSNFPIPPENLITQGYGEEFLKIPTEAAERENRRVAIRRITELIRASAD
jgi:outer membrane protein OmpA-like peptidoglycan-associated protein